MTLPINNCIGTFFSPIDVNPEIFVRIVSFLSPRNIAQLLTVSKLWYQHAGSNYLWKEFCPKIIVKNPRAFFYLDSYLDLREGSHFANGLRKGQLTTLKLLASNYKKSRLKIFGEKIIAAAYEVYDRQIQIWDRSACLQTHLDFTLDSTHCKTTQGHPLHVEDFDYIDDTLVTIGLSEEKTVVIWDSKAKDGRWSCEGHTEKVTCIEVKDRMIFSGSKDKTIRVWDKTGSLQNTLCGHNGAVNCLQVFNKMIISGSEDKTVCIWDQKLYSPVATLSKHEGSVTCIKVSNMFIASGSKDHSICLWDRSTYDFQRIFEGHTNEITCLEMIGDTLVSTSLDKTFRVWDLFTGAVLQNIKLTHSITCMKFSDNTLITNYYESLLIWGLVPNPNQTPFIYG